MIPKFRAWIDRIEKHVKVDGINFALNTIEFKSQGMNTHAILQEEDVLEQYIGLKDKHGKEIYVGDVVEVTFIFDIKERWNIISQFNFEQWNWDNILTVEIIGNIHENKELL